MVVEKKRRQRKQLTVMEAIISSTRRPVWILTRQRLAVGGRETLLEELDEHNSLSPEITGGDMDASWQTAN